MSGPVPAASGRHGATRSKGRQVRTREATPPRSAAFEVYYQAQGVVPDEDWDKFLGALRRPVPVVVRVNRTKPCWRDLQASFEADPRWRELPWFQGAWECQALDFDDGLRSQCSALNKAYALRFQEAASLVPPLLLGLKPADLLLDLCAAPGSKTLECLELMREEAHVADEGVVVANDADAERCFELLPLITRKARHPGTAVVLGSAAKFPAQFDQATGQQVLFDCIVCDVPCSGDGTLRRRPECWSSWDTKFAMTLHAKQLQILCRGLHLLRPGGRLVYSTCSLNPIENEAVVAAALARFGDDFALVRQPAAAVEAKGLQTAPGLPSWRVPHPTEPEVFFDAWDEVPEALRSSKAVVQSMFPSGAAADLPACCVRLLPHHIDGSGFFVAVFTKSVHKAFPLQMPAPPSPEAHAKIAWRARNAQNRYEVVSPDAADVVAIRNFYGLDSISAPLLAEYNVKGRLTQLNLVNKRLLEFLRYHLNCKGSPLLVAVGVPLFKVMDDNFMTQVDVPSRWRPALEGASFLGPRMSKRVLRLDADSMQALMAQRVLPMARLQELAATPAVTGLDTCGGLLGGAVAGIQDGSFWTPCIITGAGLELYARAEELGEPAPALAPPLRPEILSEGPGYTVLGKPAGLRTEDALLFVSASNPDAELVSRLDKQTSGCLLVPTTAESAGALTRQFAEGAVRKTYVAFVWGCPSDRGRVEAPLALSEVGGGSRYRAYVDEETGKPSLTEYQTMWRHADGIALLRVWPKTGRTHQIRCHMAHIGLPLVGDTKYGGRGATWCPRLPLHCLQMGAVDVEGGALEAYAPLPEDLLEAIRTLGGDAGAGTPLGRDLAQGCGTADAMADAVADAVAKS